MSSSRGYPLLYVPDFIRPICLPTEDMTLRSVPLNLTAAGWGAVSLNQSSSPIKLEVDLPYVPLDVSRFFFHLLITQSNQLLCGLLLFSGQIYLLMLFLSRVEKVKSK